MKNNDPFIFQNYFQTYKLCDTHIQSSLPTNSTSISDDNSSTQSPNEPILPHQQH